MAGTLLWGYRVKSSTKFIVTFGFQYAIYSGGASSLSSGSLFSVGGACVSDSSESPSKLFFLPAFDFGKNVTTGCVLPNADFCSYSGSVGSTG
uniref:Uncharacterized protein n=1 Tax=Arundo donax TaxID=35708 RepID=A0A0A9EIT4_ARUDO